MDSAKKLINRAVRRQQAGDRRAAEKLYKRVLKHDAYDLDANYLLGTFYAEGKKYEAALEYLNRALSVAPGSHRVHNNLGNVYWLTGWLPKAVEHYNHALLIEPNLQEAHLNLAAILQKLERPDDAIHHYQRVLEIDPGNARAQSGLADLRQTPDASA